MTSEASTTTWETLVEQYRERAARDDARIEQLRQSTEHWHNTADMLKRQRDMAEQERDAWKIRAMASEQQRQALRAERDALKARAEAAERERDAWELLSTNWQADCRVAQSQLAAERAVVEAAKAWNKVEALAYHMKEKQNAEGALVRAVDALDELEGA